MDPLQYLGALRRRWHIIVGALVISLTAGFLINATVSSETPTVANRPRATSYTSTALLLNTSTDTGVPGLTALDNSTIARLATIGEIPQRVADKMNFEGSPLDLASKVQIVPAAETGLLEVTVVSSKPDEATRLSNVYANELVEWLADRQRQIATDAAAAVQEEMDEITDNIAEKTAEIAQNPPDVEILKVEREAMIQFSEALATQYQGLIAAGSAPPGLQLVLRGTALPAAGSDYAAEFAGPEGKGLRLALAGLLGLIAGVGIALLLDRIDTRIRSKQEAEQHFRAPVLAEIPQLLRRDRGAIPIAAAKPRSRFADAFRLLATSIVRQDSKSSWEARPKLILVTSAEPGEGKSTVVANLAASFAEMGHRVLTISCDFRRPKIHEYLGVANEPGLSDAIRNSNGRPILRDNVLKSSFHEFVGVVPSGTVPDKPGELLSSEGMRRALDEARQLADVVLIDSSPVLSAGDAVLLLDDVDAVLIVARAGQTHTSEAAQTAALLARLRAPVRGVVLTGSTGSSFRHDYPEGEGSDGLRRGFSRLARHYSPL